MTARRTTWDGDMEVKRKQTDETNSGMWLILRKEKTVRKETLNAGKKKRKKVS